jgi:hypothetical protein
MYEKYEYHLDKSKDLNLSKLQQKAETIKYKELERKMYVFWKKNMEKQLDYAVKLNNKPIILIGYSTYFKNHKISIPINIPLKFFQKVDLLEHTKNIVEQNIDNYREEIIEGVFPLDFLNHDVLIKKRETLVATYKKMGYQLDTINNILNSIHVASNTTLPRRLFYASPEEHPKKLPLVDNRLIGYEDEWMAIFGALAKDHPGLIKGISNGRPFIKETVGGSLEALHKPVYLYTINNTINFAPIATKNKIYKYVTTKAPGYETKLYMDNAMEKLEDLEMDILPLN